MDNAFKWLFYYDLVTILLGHVFTGVAKASFFLGTDFCEVALGGLASRHVGENFEIWSLTNLVKWILPTCIICWPDFLQEEISNNHSIRSLYSSR